MDNLYNNEESNITANPKPSKDTLEALTEVDEMIKNPEKYPRYKNREELRKAFLADLEDE